MSTPIRPSDLFRYYRHGTPHQMAAIAELEAALLKEAPQLFNRDQSWFKTWSQAGKQSDELPPIWFEPARKIICEFEGCKLKSYQCPAGIWTIGYGHTGPDVTAGKSITQKQADALLHKDMQQVADKIHRLLPGSQYWGGNQQAALISWAYNVGLKAVEDSTLRKRLIAGDPGIIVIPQELPRWNKVNGKESPGLTRRRAAEVAFFTGNSPALQQAAPRFSPDAPFSFRVTPHITYGELCLNEERRRFVNQGQCDIATEICAFIEKARAQFGNKPVIITSGHRPKPVNEAVGGASNSEHLFKIGCGAIDWYIKGVPVKTVQNWCDKEWPYSLGYGAPKGFVHTGIRARRPRVRWDY